LGSLKKHDSL